MTPESLVAVKCDGCEQRVGRGEVPACVESCKVDALVYGEINELIAAGRVPGGGGGLPAGRTNSAPCRGGSAPLQWGRPRGGGINSDAGRGWRCLSGVAFVRRSPAERERRGSGRVG